MGSDPFEVPTAIADMMRQRLEDQAEIARLRAALESIADSPHCQYENSKDGTSYGVGVADGHRCAATTARAALAPRKDVSAATDGQAAGSRATPSE